MQRSETPQVKAASIEQPITLARRWLEGEMLLALAGVAAVLLVAFLTIAGSVSEGGLEAFDQQLMLSLRTAEDVSDPIGPKWFEEGVRDVTALGSTTVLTLLIIAVTTYMLMTGRGRTALLVVGCTLSGTLMSSLVKLAFDRPRPNLVPHQVEVYTASFPSGHALMSAVVYLTLGALISRTQADFSVRAVIMGMAIFITILVGLSRVYLGVHWPSDVLAGWCLGALWATLCWMLARSVAQTPQPGLGPTAVSDRAGS